MDKKHPINKTAPTTLPENIRDLPDILLSYQQGLLSTTATNQVVFCEKSRRIGITWAVGSDATLTAALSKADGGMNVFYMGYNLEMAREFINICADWAKTFEHACSEVEDHVFEEMDEHGDTKEIKAFRIRFASGFEIIALPSSARSLRGMQGYVIIDEAAFHDDLDEVLKAAYALLMWGGKVLAISTHDGVDNVFNQQIQGIKEKRKGFKKHKLVTITFQDAINAGLYERICLVRGTEATDEGRIKFIEEIYEFYGEGASEELDVVPSKSGGAFISGALVESRMVDGIPVVRWHAPDDLVDMPENQLKKFVKEWCEENLKPILDELDPKLKIALGEDFGRSGDLTSLHLFQIQQNMDRKTAFTVELRNMPFSVQRQIVFYIIDNILPMFRAAALDARGNGQQLAEEVRQRYGAGRVFEVMTGPSFYAEAFPQYRAGIEDGSVILPKDNDILADHRIPVVQNGQPTIPNVRTKGADKGKRHGDAFVAAALAHWASKQDVVEYDYETPGDSQESEDDDDFRSSARFGSGAY